jgi:cell division protein FtsQ
MFGGTRKRNRRKTERSARWSLAWLKPLLAGSARSVLSLCALLALALFCLWGSLWVLDRPISIVEVGGQFQRVAPVQIEEAVAPFRGAGFLSVDLDALQAAVEKVAWVDRARVERKWPSGVRVVITEHVPAARWGEHGLMNTRGELFLLNARHACS